MIKEFEPIIQGLLSLIEEWEPKLSSLSSEVISKRRNSQNRTIKQIIGHMIDSASNNIHRIVHLQYQPSPLIYPDYANLGNNDRWIAIQNYQDGKWNDLIQLWKYSNFHVVHVIQNVNADKLENEWITALNKNVSLKAMILDYLKHIKLHLNEIDELINKNELALD
ncbi:MAG: DinB family protein [Bacteroidales bacterium]|nr:DinB family protein [Bacteroidales bacterium]MDP2236143.1 DinB family protein [Bacteroidales bacterium]